MHLIDSPVFNFLRRFETPELLIERAGHHVWPIIMRAKAGRFTAFTAASALTVEERNRPRWLNLLLRFLRWAAKPIVWFFYALQDSPQPLVSSSDESGDTVIQDLTAAIALATGKQVEGVRLLELTKRHDAEHVEKPTIFDDRVFRYDQNLPFGNSLCVFLWESSWQTLRAQLTEIVGFDNVGRFEDELKALLRQEVGEPLKLRFYDQQSFVPTSPSGESILTALYYYLAFTVVGDLERMRRLEPLIRCLGRAIPIAELADYPGRWVAARVPERAA